ncbi:transcriptional regulator [Streptomyces sp. NPDC058405]|uniref:transcriptional regulator n=1 Tax=unclassified Streptomyces TaxID=2593676 RepID=UPI00365970FD
MPAFPSGSLNLTEVGDQHRRLASLLADMVPGAATFRVTLHDPDKVWPHPHARAYGAAGEPINLNRTQSVIAARWIIRTHPDAAWGDVCDFDLATARLIRAALSAAGRGR